jgi:hypothetical protein
MEDRIKSILDTIGVDPKGFQIIVLSDETSVIYPNYMSLVDLSDKGLKDEQIIGKLEEAMVEHELNVQHDLKLVKRYRRSLID